MASSRTSTGGSTGVNPFGDEPVEREAVEREREERGAADDVAEARPREPRTTLHVVAARAREQSFGSKPARGCSPTSRTTSASSSVSPSGTDSCGGLEPPRARVRACSASASSPSRRLQILLDLLELGELFRSRLALQLLRRAGARPPAGRARASGASASRSRSKRRPRPCRATAARGARARRERPRGRSRLALLGEEGDEVGDLLRVERLAVGPRHDPRPEAGRDLRVGSTIDSRM